MQPLFDAYVMVGWSAAATPVIAPDSISIAALERGNHGLASIWSDNTSNRAGAATDRADLADLTDLADRLSDLIADDRRVLVGLDFAALRPADRASPSLAGSVDSQRPSRIARLHRLRHHPRLGAITRVWPIETGLRPLSHNEDWRIIVAEIDPSMLINGDEDNQIPYLAPIGRLAAYFAQLDDNGVLNRVFAGPADLADGQRRAIEIEQGCCLGMETSPLAAQRYAGGNYRYERDPRAIYAASFAAIRGEADLSSLPPDVVEVAVRLIHACGDPAIAADLAWRNDVVGRARAALAAGAPILTDTEMVARGIINGKLPADNRVVCLLDHVKQPSKNNTRSAGAVDLWLPYLAGAVVAIGNAPTALFRLLELIEAGAPRPAAILGFPVGFIGAAESKDALIAHAGGMPYLTLRGRRGGSAMAAAAVNAVAGLAERGQ